MTNREKGLLRARTMTPEFRYAMLQKGRNVRAILNGLGKSDGRPSPTPWTFTYSVRLNRWRSE